MAAGTFQGANEFNEDDNQVFHTHSRKRKKKIPVRFVTKISVPSRIFLQIITLYLAYAI